MDMLNNRCMKSVYYRKKLHCYAIISVAKLDNYVFGECRTFFSRFPGHFSPLPFIFKNDVSLQLLNHVASFVEGLSGTM